MWLFTTLSFFSCNRADEKVPVSVAELISGRQWITTALTINPGYQFKEGGDYVTDLYGFYSEEDKVCIIDNLRFFNIKGTYTFEDGATKCNAANPQVFETGNWVLSSDETTLVTSVSGNIFNYDIISLDATTLVWRYVIKSQGVDYVFLETHTINQ
ncbi:MAG: hypothetical protein M3512_11725 [Bacteroidota bacterium]|nr:hypothetical protein [Bacteroidota bacterium]